MRNLSANDIRSKKKIEIQIEISLCLDVARRVINKGDDRLAKYTVRQNHLDSQRPIQQLSRNNLFFCFRIIGQLFRNDFSTARLAAFLSCNVRFSPSPSPSPPPNPFGARSLHWNAEVRFLPRAISNYLHVTRAWESTADRCRFCSFRSCCPILRSIVLQNWEKR